MRRFPSLADRFANNYVACPMSGCWLWVASVFHTGYGRIRFGDRNLLAHRVAWQLFRGPIPVGQLVLHHCDVHCCVNPNHLFLGTHADNTADMDAKGRARRHVIGSMPGEANGRSKLTADQVKTIRTLAKTQTYSFIAKQFRVAPSLIRRIAINEAWRHIGRMLMTARQFMIYAAGRWLLAKTSRQQALGGTYQAARNLRKAGAPLALSLLLLIGRV